MNYDGEFIPVASPHICMVSLLKYNLLLAPVLQPTGTSTANRIIK